jgi:Protein of unknown function (DUF4230)
LLDLFFIMNSYLFLLPSVHSSFIQFRRSIRHYVFNPVFPGSSVSLLIYTLLIAGLVSCNTKSLPKQKQEVLALKEMNELATAEYTITKIVKASDNKTWFKFGERKILISCTGIIKAGIDLSSLNEENISINDKDITLYLPAAKIITLNIPAENIKVEHQQTGFWRDQFNNEEQNALMAQAEQQIRSTSDSLGILQSAQTNAQYFISGFLKRLGYKTVSIEFKAPPKTNKLG